MLTTASIAVIGCAIWFFLDRLSANPAAPAVPSHWAPLCIGGLIVAVFLLILLHSVHEERVIRRTVADALRGREGLTHEEFGTRYFSTELAAPAAQLRRILAENLGCDLSGMIPSDDFEKWLYLFPGPDSAADSFFEEMAVAFRLSRDSPWPERFASFDALVKFVSQDSTLNKP